MASSELKDGKHYRTREGRILEAVLAIADCDDEDATEWHRVWVRWRKTMIDCGWKPPQVNRARPSMLTNQLPLPWRQEARQ